MNNFCLFPFSYFSSKVSLETLLFFISCSFSVLLDWLPQIVRLSLGSAWVTWEWMLVLFEAFR